MSQSEMHDTAQIEAVARRLVEHPFKGWFFGDSIGFEGLIAADTLIGGQRWTGFAQGFFRGWATRRHPFRQSDHTAPGNAICMVIETAGDDILLEAARDLAGHLETRRRVNGVSFTFENALDSMIPPYGGLSLSPDEAALMQAPGAGVYVDCMHFDAPFLAHLTRIDPAGGWAAAALREILGYRDLLLDAETGLYRHFWLERTGQAYTRGWSRGQGWALLGLLDVATLLPSGDTVSVRDAARDLARAMLDWQLPDGNWHALVHEPRSGPESSAAAFMATAFYRGMSAGMLSAEDFAEPAERAFRAMCTNLDARGNLTGVSAAVHSALVEGHYWHVPLGQIVPWGQGPVLTAFAARQRFRQRG